MTELTKQMQCLHADGNTIFKPPIIQATNQETFLALVKPSDWNGQVFVAKVRKLVESQLRTTNEWVVYSGMDQFGRVVKWARLVGNYSAYFVDCDDVIGPVKEATIEALKFSDTLAEMGYTVLDGVLEPESQTL